MNETTVAMNGVTKRWNNEWKEAVPVLNYLRIMNGLTGT